MGPPPQPGLLVDFEQWPIPGHDKEPAQCSATEWEAKFHVRVAYDRDRYPDGRPREGGIRWVVTEHLILAGLDR